MERSGRGYAHGGKWSRTHDVTLGCCQNRQHQKQNTNYYAFTHRDNPRGTF